MRNVRQRLFRGFCAHNEALPAVLEEYRGLRGEFIAVINGQPRLDERERRRSAELPAGLLQRSAERRRTCAASSAIVGAEPGFYLRLLGCQFFGSLVCGFGRCFVGMVRAPLGGNHFLQA